MASDNNHCMQGQFVASAVRLYPVQYDAIDKLARADYRSFASCLRRLVQIGLEAERQRVQEIDAELCAQLDKMRNVA